VNEVLIVHTLSAFPGIPISVMDAAAKELAFSVPLGETEQHIIGVVKTSMTGFLVRTPMSLVQNGGAQTHRFVNLVLPPSVGIQFLLTPAANARLASAATISITCPSVESVNLTHLQTLKA